MSGASRIAAFIAAATAALLALSAAPAARADSHRIDVRAVVARVASVSALRTPAQVVVTADDVARGYVEIAQPVEVEIRTNDPAGVMLGFDLGSPLVRAVHFDGEDLRLSVATGAAAVLVPAAGRGLHVRTLHLRTRLELAPGARPGVIAWPVAVFVAPS